MTPKSARKLALMREGGRRLAKVIATISALAKPGVSLLSLERKAEVLIEKAGGKPAFKGYHGYPFATCLSINEEIVHGVPRSYLLKSGDLLGIDIGLLYRGLYLDSAVTVPIGNVSANDQKLLKVTSEALWEGISRVRPGAYLGDIQAAIQRHVEAAGFTIVRDLCGHGIGANLQEEPQIPNFGKEGTGPVLAVGQTFALEPMVTFDAAHTATLEDGWTVATLDGKNAAHFEHTLAVVEGGVDVLTLRPGEKEQVRRVQAGAVRR